MRLNKEDGFDLEQVHKLDQTNCCTEEELVRLMPVHFAVVANNLPTLKLLLEHLSPLNHFQLLKDLSKFEQQQNPHQSAVLHVTNCPQQTLAAPLLHLAAHRGLIQVLILLLSASQTSTLFAEQQRQHGQLVRLGSIMTMMTSPLLDLFPITRSVSKYVF